MSSTGHRYKQAGGLAQGASKLKKNNGVKEWKKNALNFRPVKGILANGGLLNAHPGEMQTQKY